jgi:hypothetical protein
MERSGNHTRNSYGIQRQAELTPSDLQVFDSQSRQPRDGGLGRVIGRFDSRLLSNLAWHELIERDPGNVALWPVPAVAALTAGFLTRTANSGPKPPFKNATCQTARNWRTVHLPVYS